MDYDAIIELLIGHGYILSDDKERATLVLRKANYPEPSESAKGEADELWNGQAWMIEWNFGNGPQWFTGDWTSPLHWTRDPNKAVKFCTRDDALQVASAHGEHELVRETSHGWPEQEDKYAALIFARRPSAEPKTVAEFLGPQLNAELERAEAVNRADEAERRAEKAEAKLATLKAGGAVGYVDAGKE